MRMYLQAKSKDILDTSKEWHLEKNFRRVARDIGEMGSALDFSKGYFNYWTDTFSDRKIGQSQVEVAADVG